jgi:hypothetical protein
VSVVQRAGALVISGVIEPAASGAVASEDGKHLNVERAMLKNAGSLVVGNRIKRRNDRPWKGESRPKKHFLSRIAISSFTGGGRVEPGRRIKVQAMSWCVRKKWRERS